MSNRFGGAAAFRSALLVTGATYISYIVGLVVSMVIARELGPRDYGHYAYLIWLAGTLTMLFCNGLTLSTIRFVSESLGRGLPAEAGGVRRLLGSWYAISLIVVSLAFAAAYPWLQPADWHKPAWMFAVAALIAAATKSYYMFSASTAKGYGHFEIDAYTINLLSIANFVGVLIMAFIGVPIEAYIAYFVVLSVGHALVARILMRRAGIGAAPGEVPDSLSERIRKYYYWTAVLFLVFAFSNKSVETLFLNSYVGPEAVGWFAIGAAMTRGGVDLLSSGLNTVLLPMMSHAMGSDDVGRANRILTDAMRFYAFLGLTLAGIGVLWASPAIMLLYGAQYAPAIIGLQVMMVVGALTMPGDATASMLMTTDRQSVRVALAISAVLLTLAAAMAFVPRYGFEGALAAHAIARVTIFITGLIIVVRMFKVVLPYAEFLRTAAAACVGLALAASVLFVSTSVTGQLVAGAAYGLGCVVGSLLLRVWTTNDIRLLGELAGRFPRLRFLVSALEGFARRV